MFDKRIPNEKIMEEANKSALHNAKIEIPAYEVANLQLMFVHFMKVAAEYDTLTKEEREAMPLKFRNTMRNMVNCGDVFNRAPDGSHFLGVGR